MSFPLSTLVAIADEFPEMNDLLAAAYSHPMTLELIRANDVKKIKQVFSEYTPDRDDERYTENEAIISGTTLTATFDGAESTTIDSTLTLAEGATSNWTSVGTETTGVTDNTGCTKIENTATAWATAATAMNAELESYGYRYVVNTDSATSATLP